MDQTPRRQHERVKNPKVLLKVQTVERLKTYYLKDLSQGGAFIRLTSPLPLDSACTVEIHAPGLDDPLPLRAKVIRVVAPGSTTEPPGMAVRFDDPDPDKMARLKKLVDAHLERDPMELALPDSPAPAAASPVAPSSDSSAGSGSDGDGPLDALQAALAERTAELDKKTMEAADAKAELAEVQGRLSAIEEQLKEVEKDEERTRLLAERVAADKTKGEKALRDEIAQAQSELKRLNADLASTKARADEQVQHAESETKRVEGDLDAAHSDIKRLSGELAQAQGESRRLTSELLLAKAKSTSLAEFEAKAIAAQEEVHQMEQALASAKALSKKNLQRVEEFDQQRRQLEQKVHAQERTTAAAEKRASEALADLERLKKRESALRHLVDVMTTANLTKEASVEGDAPPAPAAAAQHEPVAAPAPAIVVPPPPEPVAAQAIAPPPPPEPVAAQEIAPPPPPEPSAPPPEPAAPPAHAFVLAPPPEPAAPPPEPSPAAEVAASTGRSTVPLPSPELPVEVTIEEDGGDSGDGESDEIIADDVGVSSPPSNGHAEDELPALSLDGFSAWLDQGVRVRTVASFNADSVSDPSERMIAMMLSEAMPFDELLERASAHPVRDQFVLRLYGMFQRRVVEVLRM